ncbi:MAG: VOC family protein [Pedobacter sp.]|uniref:VOC family protein n=1 Tax=Pedobacter sp. TaxID=1411316 RepID=UPI003392B79F
MKTNIKLTLTAFVCLTIAAFSASAQADPETGFVMPALNTQSPLAGMSGNHVGIRVPDYKAAVKWYTEKLDFRVIKEWPYADEQLAYLAPANSNDFWLEVLAEGKLKPVVKFNDLGKSLEESGYHHICLHVDDMDKTLTELKKRGVTLVGQPFYLDVISRKLAFFQDPWGNMIELAEVKKK